jgi:hypothetical protein
MSSVYCLYSIRDGIPQYVGKTQADPERRLKQHLARALEEDDHSPLYNWIRDVIRGGYLIDIHVLQWDIMPKELDLFERYWIRQFPNLLNMGMPEPGPPEATPAAAQVTRALQEKVRALRNPPPIADRNDDRHRDNR